MRYTSSDARLRQGGFLATHKQDFNAHWKGQDFFHTADQINMNPSLPAFPSAPTVQDTLNQMYYLISTQGTGFISVGNVDGYHLGDYNAGSLATPTVYDAFNAAFADSRLANGGIILVIAGTYHLQQTITVPPGICIMGEISGSVIVGEMSEQPMFIIGRGDTDLSIGGDAGAGAISHEMGSPLDQVRFFNLILADNLQGVIEVGGHVISTMRTVPMIRCNSGSDFECDTVRFIGRVDDGPVSGRTKTLRAIGYHTPLGFASHLKVKHCFFDGFKTAIDFNSQEGNRDFLVIENCRARTFGTENAVSIADVDNCFVSFSLCNATFANNYHVGAEVAISTVPTVRACYVITSKLGTLTDIRITILGNSGGPNITSPLPNLLTDVSVATDTVCAIKSGNAWGQNQQNDWFVTVGNATPAVDTPSGDYIGINALDTLMAANRSTPFTIILNPGTYNLTSIYGGRFKLIGNKINGEYPKVIVGDSGVLYLGILNPPRIGSYCQSIIFKTTGGTFNSVLMNFQNFGTGEDTNVIVEDCRFEDAGLIVHTYAAAAGPDTRRGIINIRNCFFYSSGGASEYCTLFLPSCEEILIENTDFSILGTAMMIGTGFGGYNPVTGQPDQVTCTLRNCYVYMRSTSFNTVGTPHPFMYITLGNVNMSKVTMDNCQVVCSRTYGNAAPVHVGIVASYFNFIYIIARQVEINNCIFNGPAQLCDVGGAITQIKTLNIEASGTRSDITMTNTKIINGSMPLYMFLFSADATERTPCHIRLTNCEFASTSSATGGTYVIAHLDQQADATSDDHYIGECTINNCIFRNGVNAGHTVIRPTSLTSFGILTINLPKFNVHISNSKIFGSTTTVNMTNGAAGDEICGLYINNHNYDGAAGDYNNQININNSEIHLVNNHNSAADNEYIYSCMLLGTNININNNVFNMNNAVGIAGVARPISCLYIECPLSTGVTPWGDVIVSGNQFSRRNFVTGALTELYRGYVWLKGDAANVRGMIIDNSFCHHAINLAGSTSLVFDSLDRKFIVERNKNQTGVIDLRAIFGIYQTSSLSDFIPTITNIGAGNATWEIAHTAAGDAHTFAWYVPLLEVLPHGTYVVSATVTAYKDAAGTPPNPRDLTLTITDVGKFDTNTISLVTSPATATASITPTNLDNANTFYVDAAGETNLSVVVAFTDAAINNVVYIEPIILTYRW